MELTKQGPITGKGRSAPDPVLSKDEPRTGSRRKQRTTSQSPTDWSDERTWQRDDKEKEAPKKSVAEESFFRRVWHFQPVEEGRAAYETLNKQFKSSLHEETGGSKEGRGEDRCLQQFHGQTRREPGKGGTAVRPEGNSSESTCPDKSGDSGWYEGWQPNTWERWRESFFPNLSNGSCKNWWPACPCSFEISRTSLIEHRETIKRHRSRLEALWGWDDIDPENPPYPRKDVSKLYRLSVPRKFLKINTHQAALRKFEDKAKSAKVSQKAL